MAERFMQTVLTPSVLAAQEHYYGRRASIGSAPECDPLTDEEGTFIEARDSFYMATITESGWPYLQHRGVPRGFLRLVSPTQLAFADYKGNRQMLSTGNLAANDRVALFLMDYPRRERLKILGHARVEDARQHPELVVQLAEPEGHRIVERLFFIGPSRLQEGRAEFLHQFASGLVPFRAFWCGFSVRQRFYNTSNTRWLTR